jgi:GDPmannose 4,6-dehydratase
MWKMLQAERPADYVIATGQANSLRAFCDCAFRAVGLDWREYVTSNPKFFRPSEIMVGLGDSGKAREELGWRAQTDMRGVVEKMIAAERPEEQGESRA